MVAIRIKKMKKLLLLPLLTFAACGTDSSGQVEVFAAEEISIDRLDVCNNLDASVKQEMTREKLAELCGVEAVACAEFEVEMHCDGEWCTVHRTCRLDETSSP